MPRVTTIMDTAIVTTMTTGMGITYEFCVRPYNRADMNLNPAS